MCSLSACPASFLLRCQPFLTLCINQVRRILRRSAVCRRRGKRSPSNVRASGVPRHRVRGERLYVCVDFWSVDTLHLNILFFFLKTRVRFRILVTPSYSQGSYEVRKLTMNVSLQSSLENVATTSAGTKQPNTFSATHVQTMCQLATGKKMVVAANGAEARHLQPSVHSGR